MKASEYVLEIHGNLRRKYDGGAHNIRDLINETCAALLNLHAMIGDGMLEIPTMGPALSWNLELAGPQAVRIAAGAFGVPPDSVESDRRTKHVAAARHMAMLLIKDACPWATLEEIGRYVGGKDHSTILYGLKQARARHDSDPSWADTFGKCKNLLRAAIAQPAQEGVAA